MVKQVAIAIGVKRAGTLVELPGAVYGAREFSDWAKKNGYRSHLLTDEKKAVTVAGLAKLIQRIVDKDQPERLLLYFAGHGIQPTVNTAYWLLSRWQDDSNEAVNVNLSCHNAKRSGVRARCPYWSPPQDALTNPGPPRRTRLGDYRPRGPQCPRPLPYLRTATRIPLQGGTSQRPSRAPRDVVETVLSRELPSFGRCTFFELGALSRNSGELAQQVWAFRTDQGPEGIGSVAAFVRKCRQRARQVITTVIVVTDKTEQQIKAVRDAARAAAEARSTA